MGAYIYTSVLPSSFSHRIHFALLIFLANLRLALSLLALDDPPHLAVLQRVLQWALSETSCVASDLSFSRPTHCC